MSIVYRCAEQKSPVHRTLHPEPELDLGWNGDLPRVSQGDRGAGGRIPGGHRADAMPGIAVFGLGPGKRRWKRLSCRRREHANSQDDEPATCRRQLSARSEAGCQRSS